MSQSIHSNLPVIFFEPDSDTSMSILVEAMQSLPPGSEVLGLLLKVERHDGQEKLVNWQFAHPDELKALALALPEDAFIPPSDHQE